MKRRATTLGLLPAIVCGVLPAVLFAAPPGAFSLGQAVPEDSWIYIHSAPNPEREFLDKHWSQVWDALAGLHIESDIRQLLMPPGNTPEPGSELAARWDKALELCKGVDWKGLASGEMVVFSRWQALPEFHVLLKPRGESVEAQVSGLVAILQELASLDPSITLTPSTSGSAKVWTLALPMAPPAGLHLFQREGVIGFSISPSVESTLALLANAGEQHPLINSPRYKKAAAAIAPPEDSLVYVDVARVLQTVRTMIAANQPPPPTATSQNPSSNKGTTEADVIQKLLAELDFLDYIIVTEQTNGLNTTKHSLVQVQEGGASKQLCKALMRPVSIAGFERYVPEDATSFSAWSGVDLEGLYDFVLDFMRKHLPNGQEHVAAWEQMQVGWGFNLKADLFSWLDGQIGMIGLPAAMPTPFAAEDAVFMIRVKDRAKALSTIEKLLARFGEAVITAPAADVSAPDFKSVVYAPMAMMGKLTYGVHDQWLMLSLATTSAAVNKCLAVAAGQGKGFKDSERAHRMEMKFDQPLVLVSFQDLKKAFQQMAQMLGMVPAMAMMSIPPTPEFQGLRAGLGIAAKVAPVLGKIDFMLDSAETCTFKEGSFKCKTVTAYKEYVPPAERTTDTPGEKSKKSLDGM